MGMYLAIVLFGYFVIYLFFFSAVWCTHYAVPHLKESKGRLVVVNSLAGIFCSQFFSVKHHY